MLTRSGGGGVAEMRKRGENDTFEACSVTSLRVELMVCVSAECR